MWPDTNQSQYARAELNLPTDLTAPEWAVHGRVRQRGRFSGRRGSSRGGPGDSMQGPMFLLDHRSVEFCHAFDLHPAVPEPPLVIPLERNRADEAGDAVLAEEDAAHAGAAFRFPAQPLDLGAEKKEGGEADLTLAELVERIGDVVGVRSTEISVRRFFKRHQISKQSLARRRAGPARRGPGAGGLEGGSGQS